ncbi:MAG: AmmeMemoRadiSam system protein B [Desulfobacterales bacterium]
MNHSPLLSTRRQLPLSTTYGGLPPRADGVRIAMVIAAALLATLLGPARTAFAAENDIRPPAVAGRFYPSDPEKLRAAVQRFLADAMPPTTQRPIAIVSPHAGYIYSGQIMADAFAQARGHAYDLVVLLGVNHTTPGFDGVSVFSGGGFRIPLGIAEIDTGAARRLVNRFPGAVLDKSVHRDEHSIEVLVPFVQVVFPGIPILPIIVSLKDDGACARFGKALAQSLADRKALIVASSDLSHYPPYADAQRLDRNTLQAMASLDIDQFMQVVRSQKSSGPTGLSTCACGEQTTLTVMAASKSLGASMGAIVSYANSGDALVGDRDRVVGYGAVVFHRRAPQSGDHSFPRMPSNIEPAPLSPSQQRNLLNFARKSLTQFIETETLPLPRPADPLLYARQGAFVTLKRHGELRGCIGHMGDDLPLCHVVGRMALQAAFNDRRFSHLKDSELEEIDIEISVLTPLKPVDGPADIVVGRDGVMLRQSDRSALFLPQVAPEQGWNRDEMLGHLCRKAGLSETAWKDGASFYTFQAQVFSESLLQP